MEYIIKVVLQNNKEVYVKAASIFSGFIFTDDINKARKNSSRETNSRMYEDIIRFRNRDSNLIGFLEHEYIDKNIKPEDIISISKLLFKLVEDKCVEQQIFN